MRKRKNRWHTPAALPLKVFMKNIRSRQFGVPADNRKLSLTEWLHRQVSAFRKDCSADISFVGKYIFKLHLI